MSPETDDEALLNFEVYKSYVEASQDSLTKRFLVTTVCVTGSLLVVDYGLSKFNNDLMVFFAVTAVQAMFVFFIYLSVWRYEKFRQRVVRRLAAISYTEMEYMELFRSSIESMDAEYFRCDARNWYTITQTKGL